MKEFASFRIDVDNQCLWRGGERIVLQPKPFAVLRYLVDHPERLITHDELLDAIWPETFVQPQVLRTYMLELRKALGDEASEPRFIETMPKRGYRFVAEVREKAGAYATRPVPAQLPPVEIVGRERELGQLRAELERATEGQRRVVFLSGAAGVGKTALADALGQSVCAAGLAMVARGQCVPGVGTREEYYPVMEALESLCESAASEVACRALGRVAKAWFARLGRDAGGTETAPAGERMPGDLCAALEEISAARPLMLIFEDLQWADAATLNLIDALARRRAAARLMVLATFRPGGQAGEIPLQELTNALLMQKLCSAISLGPLGKAGTMKVVCRELGMEIAPERLGDLLHTHSEGNPMFAIVLLKHLIAQKILVKQVAAGVVEWRISARFDELNAWIPGELAQMLELEIGRLSEHEQSLLEAGSMMNVAFPAWAVAAALCRDAAETEEACDALAQRLHFVRRAGMDELPGGTGSAFYAFSHGLYREVLYQRQSAPRRALRHVRIAERLGELFEGRRGQVAHEMAMHFEAAEDWQRAAQARREAARFARERQAHAEAAELLEQALGRAQHLAAKETEEIRRELEAARAAARV